MRVHLKFATIAVVLLAHPLRGAAQSAQRFSVQASALYINLYGDAYPGAGGGFGGEAQFRYTPSAFSIGIGFQYTSQSLEDTDTHLGMTGGFIEPRYVISTGSSLAFPYLSARFYIVGTSNTRDDGEGDVKTTATGLAINGGGGVLFRVASRVNIDVGATFGFAKFSDFKQVLPGGLESDIDINPSGTNLVLRLGLNVGL